MGREAEGVLRDGRQFWTFMVQAGFKYDFKYSWNNPGQRSTARKFTSTSFKLGAVKERCLVAAQSSSHSIETINCKGERYHVSADF